MGQLARWSAKWTRYVIARSFGAVVVVLMLFVPVMTMAQESTGETTTSGDFEIVIAPELFNRALDAYNEQNLRRAELDFSLFILLNPTYSRAYYLRARILIGEEEIERAIHDLDQAVATGANLSSAYLSEVLTVRADQLTQNNQIADALADYTQAISLEPSAVRALMGRGLLYMEQNDLERARGDFDNAIGQEGSIPLLYAYRAIITTQMNEPRAAAADYLRFLTLIQSSSSDEAASTSGSAIRMQMGLGVIHRLTFEAQAGQQVNAIAAGRNPVVDPLMVLVDQNGDALIADDNGGGGYSALIEAFTIPADGTYTLVIGHSLGGYEGQVDVSIELVGAA